MSRLFGTDGVRGLAGLVITAESAMALAQGAALVLGRQARQEARRPVAVVARDPRISGEFIAAAVAAGLASSGVDVLDASVGGIGGCPFAPGATGNIATEDVVYMLERMGVATGIDLDAVLRTAQWLGERLQRPAIGGVSRAGRFPSAAAPACA